MSRPTATTRIFLFLTLLWLIIEPAVSERHSLTYIYSALSKDLHLPGIHNFTAMRLLNGRMISYFDSNLKKLVSKQKWVEERLPPDHWAKTTFICQEEQEKFYSILNSLVGQNNSDVHTLQYMRGCEADEQPDGQLKFHRGLEMYRYDGEDFLSFNSTNLVWDASVKAAEGIMRKWNENYSKNEKIKGYLENQCLQWLTKFREYQLQQLKTAPPPEMFVFARYAKVETNIILSCWATGFYPKHIILNIKRDGRILTHQDGVRSSGVRPNEDDTYQRRDDVEILRSDKAKFTCEVIHRATSVHVEKEWDHKVSGSGGLGIGLGVVAVILLLVGVVVGVLFKKGIIGGGKGGSQGSNLFLNNGSTSSSRSNLSLNSRSTSSSNEPLEVKVPLSNNISGASFVESVALMPDKVSNKSDGSGDSGVSSSNGANGQNGTPESEAFLQNNGDMV